MSKPKSEWAGVIVVGNGHELDVRLYSYQKKVSPLGLQLVHKLCKTPLNGNEEDESDAEEAPAKNAPFRAPAAGSVAQVNVQLSCPKCQRPLLTDEIGQGIVVDGTTLLLNETEAAALKFERTERVSAEYKDGKDHLILALGTRRRLIVCPKPASAGMYADLYHAFVKSGRVAFIPELVIKGTASVGILRPLKLAASVFGKERELLVLDLLNDADALRDPAEVPSYPGVLPQPEAMDLGALVKEMKMNSTPLDPESCVSPRRVRLKQVARLALERSLRG
jgi:hypothetical protein